MVLAELLWQLQSMHRKSALTRPIFGEGPDGLAAPHSRCHRSPDLCSHERCQTPWVRQPSSMDCCNRANIHYLL